MLTAAQRDEFERWGLVRLADAVPADVANALAERVWSFLLSESGVDRADPNTWSTPRPTGFQQLTRTGALDALWSPVVARAVGDLLGSAEAHADPAINRYNGSHDRLGHPGPPMSTADAQAVIDQLIVS